jgi:hypothetical protein
MSKEKARQSAESRPFSELNASGKLAFIGKVLVFVISFGFAFPTLFGD